MMFSVCFGKTGLLSVRSQCCGRMECNTPGGSRLDDAIAFSDWRLFQELFCQFLALFGCRIQKGIRSKQRKWLDILSRSRPSFCFKGHLKGQNAFPVLGLVSSGFMPSSHGFSRKPSRGALGIVPGHKDEPTLTEVVNLHFSILRVWMAEFKRITVLEYQLIYMHRSSAKFGRTSENRRF